MIKEECLWMQDWCIVSDGALLMGFHTSTPGPILWPNLQRVFLQTPFWLNHPLSLQCSSLVLSGRGCFLLGLWAVLTSFWNKSRQEISKNIFFMLSVIAKDRVYYAQNPLKTLVVVSLKSWFVERVFVTIILCNNLFSKDIFKEQFIYFLNHFWHCPFPGFVLRQTHGPAWSKGWIAVVFLRVTLAEMSTRYVWCLFFLIIVSLPSVGCVNI